MGSTTYTRLLRPLTDNLGRDFCLAKCIYKKKSRWEGFTLIELLVVIAVSGVLVAAGVSLLNPGLQIKRANDAKRKANISKIQTALELFRSDNSAYPPTSIGLTALYQGTPQYLPKSPNGDPKSTDMYYYTASPVGCDNAAGGICTTYTLITCLENTADSDRDLPVSNAVCVSPLWSKTVTNP